MRPQYSIYDLLVFIVVVVAIFSVYFLIAGRLDVRGNGPKQVKKTSDAVAVDSEPGAVILAKRLNRWVSSRYPHLKTRIKKRVSKLKRSLVDVPWGETEN